MLANVADLPAEQRRSLMIAALNELVRAIQLVVRRARGAGGGRGLGDHQGRIAARGSGLQED